MILLALGANLPSQAGPPEATLRAALAELARFDVVLHKTSKLFVTPAWPDARDPAFVNAAAEIETTLSPSALLAALHRIEAAFGRERTERNAPRTLDLDLLDYNGRVELGPPELPHPRMAERGFVLVPLADIAPGWRHPVSGKTIEALITALPPEQRNLQVSQ